MAALVALGGAVLHLLKILLLLAVLATGSIVVRALTESSSGDLDSHLTKSIPALEGSVSRIETGGPGGIYAVEANRSRGLPGVRTARALGSAAGEIKSGPLDFTFPVRYPIDGYAGAVAMADINGDGKIDLVASGETNDFKTIIVVLEYLDGILVERYREIIDRPISYLFGGIAVGDLDRDGISEAIIRTATGLVVLSSNGNGGFRSSIVEQPGRAPIPGEPQHWSVGPIGVMDVDNDMNLDVLAFIGNLVPNEIYFGDGSGGSSRFGTFPTNAGGWADMKVGDVTGDGWPDIVSTSTLLQLVVLENDRKGGFKAPVMYPTPEPAPFGIFLVGGVAIADVNSDGRNDVVLTLKVNAPHSSIWVYEQVSGGKFSSPYSLPSADLPQSIISADFNNDALDDIAVIHAGYGVLGLYLQSKDGGLEQERLFRIVGYGASGADHYNTQGLAAADITGDGCLDVAIGDYNYGVVLIEGRNCPPPRSHHTGGRGYARKR